MTLEQFNKSVREYCEQMKIKNTHERFALTINGENILYTKLSKDTENYDLSNELGITLGFDGWVFAEVSDIPPEDFYKS